MARHRPVNPKRNDVCPIHGPMNPTKSGGWVCNPCADADDRADSLRRSREEALTARLEERTDVGRYRPYKLGFLTRPLDELHQSKKRENSSAQDKSRPKPERVTKGMIHKGTGYDMALQSLSNDDFWAFLGIAAPKES